jgi:mannan endo-1,4-beta-mannosidase
VVVGPDPTPTVFSGQTRQFTATIGGQPTSDVTWSLSYALGSISVTGLYTPPPGWESWNTVLITARSNSDPGRSASIAQGLGAFSYAPDASATAPPPQPTPPPQPAPPPQPTQSPPGAATSRPPWNTGTGFFVLDNKLYDPTGVEFRPVGLNKLHWDAPSEGLFGSNPTRANAVRWNVDFNQSSATVLGLMQKSLSAGHVPIPALWYVPSGATVTCDSGTSVFDAAVGTWVEQRNTWLQVDDRMLLNIANEWGPSDSTVWRDKYIWAIQTLRAAGYRAPIVVDSGGCGQDAADIAKYGRAVFEADPQRNVIFDLHVYGGWKGRAGGNDWQTDLSAGLDQLKATGLPILCGEFGPGRNVGPSPTLLTPSEIIEACTSHGFGWLAWAWDDPAGEYASCDDSWFCMSRTGDYQGGAELTTFGREVIEGPNGVKATAQKATVLR